jgi:hypothetical protein
VVEIEVTDQFRSWYEGLTAAEQDPVRRVVNLLAAAGVGLGHPYSSAIEGTVHPLRELRVQSRGRAVRVFYAFDPQRQAVLLLAGDKTGDPRFYERMVPLAERLWLAYLASIRPTPGRR